MLKLNEKERKTLQNHKFIEKVTEKQVTFSFKFKLQSVQKYFKGKSASLIFKEAKFPVGIFSNKYTSGCLNRWRTSYKKHGEKGLSLDKRGQNAINSTDLKDMNIQDLLERVEYLEQENNFLKKLKALKEK